MNVNRPSSLDEMGMSERQGRSVGVPDMGKSVDTRMQVESWIIPADTTNHVISFSFPPLACYSFSFCPRFHFILIFAWKNMWYRGGGGERNRTTRRSRNVI